MNRTTGHPFRFLSLVLLASVPPTHSSGAPVPYRCSQQIMFFSALQQTGCATPLNSRFGLPLEFQVPGVVYELSHRSGISTTATPTQCVSSPGAIHCAPLGAGLYCDRVLPYRTYLTPVESIMTLSDLCCYMNATILMSHRIFLVVPAERGTDCLSVRHYITYTLFSLH